MQSTLTLEESTPHDHQIKEKDVVDYYTDKANQGVAETLGLQVYCDFAGDQAGNEKYL